MVYLRAALQSDIDLLNFFKSDPVSHEDHVKWYRHIMEGIYERGIA